MGNNRCDNGGIAQFEVEDALQIKDNYAKYKYVKSILIKGSCVRIPKISICIPTYKRVRTLKDTIESCLAQVDYEDYVIIVSDNNPERWDETEQYISSLNNDRILYYKHELNIGMYGNLNRIYELSKSAYTVCIHDDDLLFPHFLSICYNFMINHPGVDILYPGKINWQQDTERPIEKLASSTYCYKMDVWDLISGNPFPPTGMMAKTKSIRQIGGYDEATYPSSDYYFNVKAIDNLDVRYLEQPLYIYRWDINTSLKKETVYNFLVLDEPLVKYLARRAHPYRVFAGLFVNQHALSYRRFCKKYLPTDNYDDVFDKAGVAYSPYNIFLNKLFAKCFSWFYTLKRRSCRECFIIAVPCTK